MSLLSGLQKLLGLGGGGRAAGQAVEALKRPGILPINFGQNGPMTPAHNPMDQALQRLRAMPYIQPKQLMPRQGGQMQPFGRGYEDEYTAAAALENTGYYNPQVTQNTVFRQGGYNPQQQDDSLRRLLGY